MTKVFAKFVASLAATASVTGGWAGSAFAASSGTGDPSGLRQQADDAIAVRLTSLQSAATDVTANRWITPADKSTLLTTLQNDTSGLQQLQGRIATDPLAQLRTDYQSIFLQYRVYLLALPQVRFAAAADDLTAGVLPHLTDAQQKLEALLSGPDSGKDSPAVQAAMSDLASQIQAITSATNGLSATVLAYTPAQYDANHALLDPARQALTAAEHEAESARQDVATVLGVLA
jgi:hypothetical protein